MLFPKVGLEKRLSDEQDFRPAKLTYFTTGSVDNLKISNVLYLFLYVFLLFFPFSPNGKKFRSKPQLIRHLGDSADLTTFDFRTGKVNSVLFRKNRMKAQPDYGRGIRNDTTLVSPIRQTASIFKQPVTVIRSQECKVRLEVKHGHQDKPRQLFWEKRLENLKFKTDESDESNLSGLFKPVGPYVKPETALQVVYLILFYFINCI